MSGQWSSPCSIAGRAKELWRKSAHAGSDKKEMELAGHMLRSD